MRIRLFQRGMRLRRFRLLLSHLSTITEPGIQPWVNRLPNFRFKGFWLSVERCCGNNRFARFRRIRLRFSRQPSPFLVHEGGARCRNAARPPLFVPLAEN